MPPTTIALDVIPCLAVLSSLVDIRRENATVSVLLVLAGRLTIRRAMLASALYVEILVLRGNTFLLCIELNARIPGIFLDALTKTIDGAIIDAIELGGKIETVLVAVVDVLQAVTEITNSGSDVAGTEQLHYINVTFIGWHAEGGLPTSNLGDGGIDVGKRVVDGAAADG